MSATAIRPEIPPMPDRCKSLPVDPTRGYPVPWFVEWLDDHEQPVPPGEGRPEFRMMSHARLMLAVTEGRCWVCGGRMGRFATFNVGPMCVVNRTSAEPPSHLDCADWSARACPFLTRPHARRREAGMPAEATQTAGIAIMRNPGVAVVWTTRNPSIRRDPHGGILFDIGDPEHIRWYCEGRPATHDEIIESIDTGLPLLREIAAEHGQDEALDKAIADALTLVPA